MTVLKTYVSSLLLIVAIFYSINLHGLSHAFEDNHSDNSNPCELCIINSQKDQMYFAIHPDFYDYDFNLKIIPQKTSNKTKSDQNFVQGFYFLGQSFNKPPPYNT